MARYLQWISNQIPGAWKESRCSSLPRAFTSSCSTGTAGATRSSAWVSTPAPLSRTIKSSYAITPRPTGSLEHIRSWARGELPAQSRNPALSPLITPPISKPVPFIEISPAQAVAPTENHSARLVLIQTGANLGFAGGNNAGLRYALRQGDFGFAWLLNNDTVVRPDALSDLVRRMQERPDAGICGLTLLYYDDPAKVQACGGSIYNKWFARGGHIGKLANAAHSLRRRRSSARWPMSAALPCWFAGHFWSRSGSWTSNTSCTSRNSTGSKS